MTSVRDMRKPDHTTRGRLLARLVDVNDLPAGSGSQSAWYARRAVERLLRYWPLPLLERLAEDRAWHITVRPAPNGTLDCASPADAGVVLAAGDLEPAAGPATSALASMLVRHIGHLEGGAEAARLREAVADLRHRLGVAYALGYTADSTRASLDEYLATLSAHYMADRRTLSVADPAGYAIAHSTVFSAAFWRSLYGVPGVPDARRL